MPNISLIVPRKVTREWLLSMVDPVPIAGCWLWSGCVNHTRGGYGIAEINHRPRRVHRVAFELFKGPIPPGMFVLHKCDVTCCVNPSHLYAGTNRDNMLDMRARGRQPQTPWWVHRPKPMMTIRCTGCGTPFERRAMQFRKESKRGRRPFCSPDCVRKYARSRRFGASKGDKQMNHNEEVA